MFNPLEAIGNIVGEVGKTVREFVPDPDQASKLSAQLSTLLSTQMMKLIDEGGKNIRADAASKSWLARNIRPLMGVWAVSMITMHWFDLLPNDPTAEEVDWLMMITYSIIIGYIPLRSVEKLAPQFLDAIKKK